MRKSASSDQLDNKFKVAPVHTTQNSSSMSHAAQLGEKRWSSRAKTPAISEEADTGQHTSIEQIYIREDTRHS